MTWQMNPQIKELWLRALRSDIYKQGAGRLTTGEFHCCLGVLCEIAVKHGVVQKTFNKRLKSFSYNEQEGVLPKAVIEWAGLPNENPEIGFSFYGLAKINDYGTSFREIADMIEVYL